jgi:hypothetical protein
MAGCLSTFRKAHALKRVASQIFRLGVFWRAYLREDSLKYDRELRSFGSDDFQTFLKDAF